MLCVTLLVLHLFRLVSAATPTTIAPHPRLLLNDTGLADLIARLKTSTGLMSIYTSILGTANSSLNLPLTPFSNCTVVGACRNAAVFGTGASYLDVSTPDSIIMSCALIHRLLNTTQPTVYSNRAIKELLHVSTNWTSWYWPVGQALERGGISFTTAVAYDWLYPLLSGTERTIIEDAMGNNVLLTRLQDERQGMWWINDIYNWNINSNSGILAITQSLADVPRWMTQASAVESILLNNLPTSVQSFEPEGVWSEGQTYSMYAAVSLLQGCEAYRTGSQSQSYTKSITATQHDKSVLPPLACSYPAGVCAAGRVWIIMTGPRGESFNWGDASPESPDSRALFKLGEMCNETSYLAAGRSFGRTINTWIDLIWYSDEGSMSELYSLPLAEIFADPNEDTAYGRKTHLGSFRSAWSWPSESENGFIPANSSAAVWLAFKGGENAFNDHQLGASHNNHGHLDCGNFVFESQGVRWAIDLGADAYDYPLLSYFGRFRFSYYFVSSYGHNVLSFDGDSQHRQGSGGIIDADLSIQGRPRALVDLTKAYAGSATNVTRSFELLGDSSIDPACVRGRIIDKWIGGIEQVDWIMHTTATVDLSSGSPRLSVPGNDATLLLSAETQDGYTINWSVVLLNNDPPQRSTYQNEPVYVLKGSVAAMAGLFNVTLIPCV